MCAAGEYSLCYVVAVCLRLRAVQCDHGDNNNHTVLHSRSATTPTLRDTRIHQTRRPATRCVVRGTTDWTGRTDSTIILSKLLFICNSIRYGLARR
jgi:hypothetical protein